MVLAHRTVSTCPLMESVTNGELFSTYSSDSTAPAAMSSLPLPRQSRGPIPKRRGLSLSCEFAPLHIGRGTVVAGALSKRCAAARDVISMFQRRARGHNNTRETAGRSGDQQRRRHSSDLTQQCAC